VLSVRFSTGSFGLAGEDRRHVRLPRIGLVRTHESTRTLAHRIAAGTARIRLVTVSYRRGRWQASFSVEVDRAEWAPARPGSTVGVDVGVTHLAVLSTGAVAPNPRPLERVQRQLRQGTGCLTSSKLTKAHWKATVRTGKRDTHRPGDGTVRKAQPDRARPVSRT
jgi:putative transposase